MFQIPSGKQDRYLQESPLAAAEDEASELVFPGWGRSGLSPRAGPDASAWRKAQVLLSSLLTKPRRHRQILTALRCWRPPSLRGKEHGHSCVPHVLAEGQTSSTVLPRSAASWQAHVHTRGTSATADASPNDRPPTWACAARKASILTSALASPWLVQRQLPLVRLDDTPSSGAADGPTGSSVAPHGFLREDGGPAGPTPPRVEGAASDRL